MDGCSKRDVGPVGPWIVEQTWHNLLFAHWPVEASALGRLLPPGLVLDTFGGRAFVGVVAFRLSGVRLRGCPPLAPVSHFPEVNVRTYVTLDGRPGVFFLSLDANNPIGIALARPWFRLPYRYSRISFSESGGEIRFAGWRPGAHAAFSASYRPSGPPALTQPGTLEHWLTERYCYYTTDRRGCLCCCDIRHDPWPLQPAEATIGRTSLVTAGGIALPPVAPALHYAHFMRARFWPVRGVQPARDSNRSMSARTTSRLDRQKSGVRVSMPNRAASVAASAMPVEESRSS